MNKSDVKRLAFDLQKRNVYPDLSYCQILDKISKDLGFQSWNHFCASIK